MVGSVIRVNFSIPCHRCPLPHLSTSDLIYALSFYFDCDVKALSFYFDCDVKGILSLSALDCIVV